MNLFSDPNFSVALAFFGLFIFMGRFLWKSGKETLQDHYYRISHPLEEAQRLCKEAEALLEKQHQKKKQQALRVQNILDLARSEAAEIFSKMKQRCEEASRAQQYSLDQQATFLHHHWEKECFHAICVLLEEKILTSLQKSNSFSILSDRIEGALERKYN